VRVGLTGNIGSGKSTVARLLAARGAAVIDADELARAATRDPVVVARIGAAFGDEVVPAGVVDRAALAARVFGDAPALRRLEAIVHPWVRAAAREREAQLVRDVRPRVIVHDVPLLFEHGLDAGLDATIVVVAPLEVRVERVSRRNGLAPAAVRARDAAQMPLEAKAARATIVIDNAGAPEALEPQVDAAWSALLARADAHR
jgi:dephospho-CoA kinase